MLPAVRNLQSTAVRACGCADLPSGPWQKNAGQKIVFCFAACVLARKVIGYSHFYRFRREEIAWR